MRFIDFQQLELASVEQKIVNCMERTKEPKGSFETFQESEKKDKNMKLLSHISSSKAKIGKRGP